MSSSDVGPNPERDRARSLHGLREEEKRIIETLRRHGHVTRNVEKSFEEQMSFGDRMADRLAEMAGSWRFILIFLSLIGVWIILNASQLIFHAFDPYPFILLNLFLSLVAGIQAPVIMMSQNRQEDRDRLHAQNDYEVNLKAELEIEQLHEKMDELRLHQWQDLLEIQDRQIQLLHQQIELLQGLVGPASDGNAS